MSAPQTGTYSDEAGRSTYPPTPPRSDATAPDPRERERERERERVRVRVRRQFATAALLILLTSITLGVTVSSIDVFWYTFRFLLVLYTVAAWIVWLLAWRD